MSGEETVPPQGAILQVLPVKANIHKPPPVIVEVPRPRSGKSTSRPKPKRKPRIEDVATVLAGGIPPPPQQALPQPHCPQQPLKISYCTTCYNRWWQLQKALVHNLAILAGDAATEIVVVDFGGEDSEEIATWMRTVGASALLNGRLRYYQRRRQYPPMEVPNASPAPTSPTSPDAAPAPSTSLETVPAPSSLSTPTPAPAPALLTIPSAFLGVRSRRVVPALLSGAVITEKLARPTPSPLTAELPAAPPVPVQPMAMTRVSLEPFVWNVAIAKNVSHRLATGEIVVNLDGDNYLQAQDSHILRRVFSRYPGSVVHQTWNNRLVMRLAERLGWNRLIPRYQVGDRFYGSFGRISCLRSNWLRLGGYDEEMIFMGFQDTDLLVRAARWGLRYRPRRPLEEQLPSDAHIPSKTGTSKSSTKRSKQPPSVPLVGDVELNPRTRPYANNKVTSWEEAERHNNALSRRKLAQGLLIRNSHGFAEPLENYQQLLMVPLNPNPPPPLSDQAVNPPP